MTRTDIRRGAASIGLATILGVAALAPVAAQDAEALPVPTIPETPDAMEFLYAPASFYAPFFVAEDKGYFDAYGVDVTLAEKAGSAETTQLLAAGQSQAGGETWGSGLLNSIEEGAPISIVSQLARVPEDPEATPVSPFIVSKARFDAGELTTVADLAPGEDGTKKKVGSLPGAFAEYSVHLALQSAGLTFDDVEVSVVPPPDAAAALDSGQIDASFTIEPLASAFAAEGLTASISDGHAAGTELAFIAFNDAWLQENSDTAIRFIAAYLKAARELESGGWDDPEIRDIVAKWTGLGVDVLGQIGLTETSEDGSIDEASVRDQEAYFREAGHLTYEGDADLASIFRPEILAAANAFLEANP
jgi:NitT/TauT family transport system substrate-binding protein